MSKEYTRQVTAFGNLPIAGSVILHDNFENLLNWTKMSGVGDSIFEPDPSIARHGNQSLLMKTRTTGAAANDYIAARLETYVLPSKIISIATNFRFTDYTNINWIYFDIIWYDGTDYHTTTIRFKPNTPSWEYRNSGGTYTALPAFAQKLNADSFHRLALRTNFATSKFLFLEVDHFLSDLSAQSLYSDGAVTDAFIRIEIGIYTIGGTPVSLYLDDLIIHEL